MKIKAATAAIAAALCAPYAAVGVSHSVVVFFVFVQSPKMNPPYLIEMPSVERVMQEVKGGADPGETLAVSWARCMG